ncbi:MAG: fimbria major subunit [Muribaculaceae bacterium]|nr:fimbria major subunit [Muribaculaceae bacterium]
MEKFKFLSGIMGLALLASCSSDAPSVIDNAPSNEKYLAINFVQTGGTRADNNALAGESTIKDLQLIILDSKGIELVREISTSIDGNKAEFGIKTVVYNMLKEKTAAGEALSIYVYANGIENGIRLDNPQQLLSGVANIITWDKSKGFLMSNAEEVKNTLQPAPTGEDAGQPGNAWVIAGDVKLARLATRFDYKNNVENDEYVAGSDKNLTIKVVGMAPVTHATATYRLPQFSATGGTTGMAPFKTTDRPYAVTENSTGILSTFQGHDFSMVPGTNEKVYGRPNTIRKGQTAAFNNSPYVAVKAEFSSATLTKSMALGENVYSVNGVFIGGVEDLKAMGGTFNVETKEEYADGSDEMVKIQNAIDMVNGYLAVADFTKPKAQIEARLKQVIGSAREFKATNVGTAEEPSYKYYTYYSQLIEHDPNQTDQAFRYNILRNHVYNLGVNSIAFLGYNRDNKPGDADVVDEANDFYISLSVSVADWILNVTNEKLDL